jgi:hypothetical protein
MPRDGSGIYSTLVGTDGIPDRTIESARYNANVHDVEADLNAPRPIVAGGTGATNARDAINNLGGELTNQVVTNYDSFQFLAGSFSSDGAAIGSPVNGHGFAGICYVYSPDNTNLVLEARDLSDGLTPGKLYIRRKEEGVWGAWVWDDQATQTAADDAQTAADNAQAAANNALAVANTKVAKAGDTMTGDLFGTNIYLSGNYRSNAGFYSFDPTDGRYLRYHPGGYFELSGGTTLGLAVNGTVQSSGNVVALGGTYFFQSAGPSLQFVSGLFVFSHSVQANGGVVIVNAAAGGNSNVYLRDDLGNDKAYIYWSRANNTVNIQHPAANPITLNASGYVFIGNGMFGKAGPGGAYDTNAHNFYWTGSAAQVWIDAVNVGNISITCDYRIKKDVTPLGSAWNAVKALRPIAYTQREYTPPGADKPLFIDDDTWQWGFMAHELQEALLPSAATGTKDSPTDIQSPNLLAIVAALTRALQEAQARIEALEARR